MSRFVPTALAAFLLVGGGAAWADVEVFATIDKTKDIDIDEVITIDKNVFVDVDVVARHVKAAESEALVNQDNFNNESCENCAEKLDLISGSGNDNSGEVNINAAAGNNNNQANAVSVAVDLEVGGPPPTTPEVPEVPEETNGVDPPAGGFANSQAAADQENRDNDIEAVNLLFRDVRIRDSLNRNSGIVGANVSAGNQNNQANLVSIALAIADDGVALSEADLGQENHDNNNFESTSGANGFGISKTASISGSVSGGSGVVGVNVSSGNMANQANVVSIAAAQTGN